MPRPSLPPTPGQRRLVKAGLLAVAGLLVGGAAYVLTEFPPTDASFYPKCQLHSLTGLHCPGCGMTRFASAALRGDLTQAAAYNALGLAALPFVAVWAAQQLWGWLWGATPRRWFPPRWAGRVTACVLVVLAAFFVLRNIPAQPFTLLAPHELTR